MNLRQDRRLRAVAHALLAFIGVVLLGTGLALLSGVTQSGQPNAATALVMVRPVPDDLRESRREAEAQRRREADAHRRERYRAPAEPAHREPSGREPPRAPEPPRHEGRPVRWDNPARLAIVIDDIGHTVEAAQPFVALGYPLTFSVLPDVPHARETADLIQRAGREYIIHLPMEPLDYPVHDPGPYPLLLSQGLEETAYRVRVYMNELPGAIGASNHMGSAYTYDADRMRVVQTVLADHNLFFLNSKTSPTSVPREVASRWGYPYLERDVFLDHDLAERAIERAFDQAVHRARSQRYAIAIGHPHPQTWRVLNRNLPRLASQGVEVVPLSNLLGH